MSILQVRIHVRYDHRTVKDHDKLLQLVVSQIESVIDKGLLITDDGEVVDDFAVDAHYRGYAIPENPAKVLASLEEAIRQLKHPGGWPVGDVERTADDARYLVCEVLDEITPLMRKAERDGKKGQ